jgi:hypothetical protein
MSKEEEKMNYNDGSNFIKGFIDRIEKFLETGVLEKTHQDFIKCYT